MQCFYRKACIRHRRLENSRKLLDVVCWEGRPLTKKSGLQHWIPIPEISSRVDGGHYLANAPPAVRDGHNPNPCIHLRPLFLPVHVGDTQCSPGASKDNDPTLPRDNRSWRTVSAAKQPDPGSLSPQRDLTAQHPDPAVAARWPYWAACLAILVPVAPYEIFAIFPVNDQVKEIDAQIGKVGVLILQPLLWCSPDVGVLRLS